MVTSPNRKIVREFAVDVNYVNAKTFYENNDELLLFKHESVGRFVEGTDQHIGSLHKT